MNVVGFHAAIVALRPTFSSPNQRNCNRFTNLLTAAPPWRAKRAPAQPAQKPCLINALPSWG
jgi:hypothetical protein